jgi:four helix bundle protein
MKNHKFKDFKVWQKSMTVAKEVYLISATFPPDERFGLTSQVRRCAVSVPSNIAEGSGRNSNADFARFLAISLGSAYELETQLLLAELLGFIESKQIEVLLEQLTEIQKMIYTLQVKFEK